MKTEAINTKAVGDYATIYSCNYPGDEICKKKGILQIGAEFGLQACEVLLIPLKLFKNGLSSNSDVAKIQGEKLMRDLSSKKR